MRTEAVLILKAVSENVLLTLDACFVLEKQGLERPDNLDSHRIGG